MIEIDESIIDPEELFRRIKAKVARYRPKREEEIDDRVGGESPYGIIFPYHLFHRGERILLVGSRDFLRCFSQQLSVEQYVSLSGSIEVAMQDRRVELREADKLYTCCYDFVVLAVRKKERAKAIKKRLVELGVDEKIIKWDGESYAVADFLHRVYLPLLEHLRW